MDASEYQPMNLDAENDARHVDSRPEPVEAESTRPGESDQSLLRRTREGEGDAATALYYRYARRLQQLAQRQVGTDLQARVDPESIVQSVFRTFFRRVSEGQYEVPAGDELWKLLLVMALNKIRSKATFHRASKRNVEQTLSLDAAAGTDPGVHSEDEAHWILKLTIDEILERMPDSHRQVVLYRIEGHQVEEIAEKTQKSKRTVERLLQKFRQSLEAEVRGGEEG